MKKIILGCTILFFNFYLLSQNYDYNWILGDFHDGNGFNIINFDTNPPNITTKQWNIHFGSYILSASDERGNLIFYSNGLDIYNKYNELMKNSLNFNYPDFTVLRDYFVKEYKFNPSEEAILFIPLPDSPSKYIIFHQCLAFLGTYSTSSLYFTIIDLNGDNGKGEVVVINELLRHNIDGVALTKHANGKDWWLTTSDYLSNEFLVYQIDSTGIASPLNYRLGPEIDYFSHEIKDIMISSIRFSPDGKILCRNKAGIGLFILDFDRSNGELTYRLMNMDYGHSKIAFSKDSRYIYKDMYYDNRIKQYNVRKDQFYTFGFYNFSEFELAPDGIIYASCGPMVTDPEYLNYLCYISRPDLPAVACDPHINTIKLPKTYSFGLPHYLNYRLGPLVNNIQDKISINDYIYKFSDKSRNHIDIRFTHREFSEKEMKVLIKIFGTSDTIFMKYEAQNKFKHQDNKNFFDGIYQRFNSKQN